MDENNGVDFAALAKRKAAAGPSFGERMSELIEAEGIDHEEAYRRVRVEMRAAQIAAVVGAPSKPAMLTSDDVRSALPHPPSLDQQVAFDAVMEKVRTRHDRSLTICSLTGPAGTGKTTMLRWLIMECQHVDGLRIELAALTGKAAVNARKATGVHAWTVHALWFGRAKEEVVRDAEGNVVVDDDGEPKTTGKLLFKEPTDPGVDVVFIDEASMLNKDTADQLESCMSRGAGRVIVYCGDHAQLPPVEGGWGVDWEHATASLTQVHRQADGSPVLSLATAYRLGENFAWPQNDPRLVHGGTTSGEACVEWLVAHRLAKDDATLITFTNKVRNHLNMRVRQRLGFARAPHAIVDGEHMLCKANNRMIGIMNGEVLRVRAVEPITTMPFQHIDTGGLWLRVTLKGRKCIVMTRMLGGERREWGYIMRRITASYADDPILLAGHAAEWAALADGFGDDSIAEDYDDVCRIAIAAQQNRGARRKRAPEDSPQGRLAAWLAGRHVFVDYGQCITVHASQGSQWEHVGFAVDSWLHRKARESEKDADFVRRLIYTGMTRASENLTMWTLGR